MKIKSSLNNILVCPICKGNLRYSDDGLTIVCNQCPNDYQIEYAISNFREKEP